MAIKKAVLVAGLALSLIACSTPEENKSLAYTGIGTAAGAGTASLMGASKATSLLAAIFGGAVGYYISLPNVLGETVTIIVPSDALFDPATSTLKDHSEEILIAVADIVSQYPSKNILITSNTSSIGTYQYEDRISEEQAKKVAQYFYKYGIYNEDTNREINIAGLGSREPIANPMSAKGIYQNRRIQVTLYNDRIDRVQT
jgi:outer membrane protein OmpA-like peptidoglycan-associated protein